jgi:hypothetical protein
MDIRKTEQARAINADRPWAVYPSGHPQRYNLCAEGVRGFFCMNMLWSDIKAYLTNL